MPSKPIQFGAAGIAAAMLSLAPLARAGVDQESNIDGYDPAVESFRVNEARRLNAINRQLELKYHMLWLNGFDLANPPVEQPIGHESEQVGPNKWRYRPIYPEAETVVPLEAEPVEIGPTIPELLPQPEALPAGPAPRPAPTLQPKLPAPSDAKPSDRIPPKPRSTKPSRGPREF